MGGGPYSAWALPVGAQRRPSNRLRTVETFFADDNLGLGGQLERPFGLPMRLASTRGLRRSWRWVRGSLTHPSSSTGRGRRGRWRAGSLPAPWGGSADG